MGTHTDTMRAFVLLSVVALAAAAPKKLSSKFLSTPMARGGGRIVGGTEATPGEFPHQIMLLRGGVGGSLMCGGSLVSTNRVITAGHCCDGQSASRLGVRVGAHSLHGHDQDQADIAVTAVKNHEDYDSWTIENDICMLDLAEDADFGSDVIGAIDIPADGLEYPAGTICTVSGWGTTTEGGHLAHNLMKVQVPVVSDADCRDAYGQNDITDSMICAGLEEGGKDSCQGDSGGPFICGEKGSEELIGVVSWGIGCARKGYPGVYTEVSYFADWIAETMA